MRSSSLITLSIFISSVIAIYPFSNQNVEAEKTDYNVGCGSDVYSIAEVQQATIHGCKSVMNRYKCGGPGTCATLKIFVGPNYYFGPGFDHHDKDVYVWGLPKRPGSNYVSRVLFDIDPQARTCMTLGATSRNKYEGGIFYCYKLQIQSNNDLAKSKSRPRHPH